MNSPLKIAIIGTGLIGPRHAETVLKVQGAELACVVDPNPSAYEIATKFECPLFDSVTSMLASFQPDAAIVCTPNHTHVQISKELIAGGVHVLCEKPISIDVASGQDLVEFAAAHHRHLLIGHHRRFNPYVIAAKQLISSLGRVIAVNGLWTIYKPGHYFDPPTEWRRSESAGPILINMIHDIDIMHHLFGPITRVYAEGALSQRDFAAEEGAAITIRFESGIIGTFLLSDAVVSPHNFESGTGENPNIPRSGEDFYRIFGSEGSLSIPDLKQWKYREGAKSWTETLYNESSTPSDSKTPFELQLEHFIHVVQGKEVPSCSGAEGLRAVRVCEAIKLSIQERRPIDVLV